MPDSEPPTEAELSAALLEGDDSAFAEVYERYSDRVFSYCLTVLRDGEQAMAATYDTFIEVVSGLDESADPPRLEAKLFAAAREQTRMRRGAGPAPAEELVRSLTQDLAVDAARAGLIVQVWEAMEALPERDQELMTLHLMEGLEGANLAEAMHVEMAYLDDLIERMQSRVQRALGPLLIARLGSDQCDTLADLLEGWDGEFTSEVRADVAKHIGGCETCQTERVFLTGPGEKVLPVIMMVTAPPPLRDLVIEGVAEAIEPPDLDEEETSKQPPDPPPASDSPSIPVVASRSRVPARDSGLDEKSKLFVFAGVTLLVGLIGLAVSAQFEAPSPLPVRVPLTSSTSTSTVTTPPATGLTVPAETDPARGSVPTTAPPGPGMLKTSTDSIDFGDDGTNAEFQISNTGGQPVEFSVSSSADAVVLSSGGQVLEPGQAAVYDVLLDRETVAEGDLNESITVAWDGESIEIGVAATQNDNPVLHDPKATPPTVQVDGCPDSATTVSVRVRDRSPLDSVVVQWSPDGGGTRETPMEDVGGDIFQARIGPFTRPQSASVRMVARDEFGNAGGATISVEVVACS